MNILNYENLHIFLSVIAIILLAIIYTKSYFMIYMNYEILQIAIIIIGWLVIYFSNLRTQKEALKSDIHLKIYEGLYNKKNKLDKISIELGVSLFFMELTFSSMESVKVIESELKPWEYNLKAIEKWNEYVNTIDK